VLLKYGYDEPVRVCVSCHEVCTQSEELMAAISANGYVAGQHARTHTPHVHERTCAHKLAQTRTQAKVAIRLAGLTRTSGPVMSAHSTLGTL
jgi:hypothetical protein